MIKSMREHKCANCLHGFISPIDRDKCMCVDSRNENYMKTINPNDVKDCYIDFSRESLLKLREKLLRESMEE